MACFSLLLLLFQYSSSRFLRKTYFCSNVYITLAHSSTVRALYIEILSTWKFKRSLKRWNSKREPRKFAGSHARFGRRGWRSLFWKYATSTFPIRHLICPTRPAPPRPASSPLQNKMHNPCLSFPLGITVVPREIENNSYAFFFFGGGGGANKVSYGKCGSGVQHIWLFRWNRVDPALAVSYPHYGSCFLLYTWKAEALSPST